MDKRLSGTKKQRYVEDYRTEERALKYERQINSSRENAVTNYEIDYLTRLLTNQFSDRKISYLDVATGTGRILKAIAPVADEISSVDSSMNMLQVARSKGVDVPQIISDATALPFRDESFDLLTAFRLFIYLPEKDRVRMLSESHRVLKPGGVLVFDIHHNSNSVKGVVRSLGEKITGRRPRDKVGSFHTTKLLDSFDLVTIDRKPIFTSLLRLVQTPSQAQLILRFFGAVLPGRLGDIVVFASRKPE